MRTNGSRRRVAMAALMAGGLFLVASVAVTHAAFTDNAILNLGTGDDASGIGNPNMFDIAVRDTNGVLQDASTHATAVVLTTTGGTQFSEDTPVVFSTHVVNREPGIVGAIVARLWDPDPVANDLYADLRFTITLDESATAVVTSATADEVNAANLTFADVVPGGEHVIHVSVLIVSGAGISVAGKATSLGVQFDGVSQ